MGREEKRGVVRERKVRQGREKGGSLEVEVLGREEQKEALWSLETEGKCSVGRKRGG